ncbi:C1 family peptidase [Hwangdonia lutea]|uniref:Aminopeptidase n=1 Tax=Hwangdonia lutea TaxID=3075823 RepID=A0AA97HR34_9FLAO|nr:C1 family peptidase [Hwangdonia sp. SCSIO 19198]WOD43008.1 C1 family peptidase [Hwangdonia sp. SCSIO 19198]
MKNSLIIVILIFVSFTCNSQSYEFETVIDLETTDVISQGNTGTCWSFSASSFLESEIMRITGKNIDLSEMYTVRNTYPKKAWNYIMRQGKAQFSEGGLAHDVINSVADHGLVPNVVYPGLETHTTRHNHAEMIAVLKGMLDVYIKNPGRQLSPKWKLVTESVLDIYLGKNISTFNYEDVQYTPESFLKMTKINPKDYISITSFSHQPFNTNFILNIPDNFSNGSFLNVKLNDLVDITNNALKAGYTVELDCDVSEKTFSSKHGLAVIPKDDINKKEALENVRPEKEITQNLRQQEFENYNTTDDHLMHITGMLKDQNGTTYYKVKNSWGKNSDRVANDGYIYMSESYFKLKTISIMVHKDVVPKKLLN